MPASNKEFFKKTQSLRKYGGLTHKKWRFDDAIPLVLRCNSVGFVMQFGKFCSASSPWPAPFQGLDAVDSAPRCG